jgi:hypothetical protein
MNSEGEGLSMRVLFVVLGAIAGWILLGVATSLSLALVVVYGGAHPDLERYGGALGALGGIIIGGLAGNAWYRRQGKRAATATASRRPTGHIAPSTSAPGAQPTGGVLPKLEELDGLHDAGRISTDEWQELRNRILGAHFGEPTRVDNAQRIRAPGWYPASNGYSEAYWDGKAWTDRRG